VTERQAEVLRAIIDYRTKNGVSPTVRELGALVGIGSPNGMMCHLRRLRQLRQITWTAGSARSIVPTTGDHPVTVNLTASQAKKFSAAAKNVGLTLPQYCEALLER
jgi:SOS-response transcriptional repressor LexA